MSRPSRTLHVFLIPKAELAALCLLHLAVVQTALRASVLSQVPPPASKCTTRACFGTQALQPSVRGEYRQHREEHTGGRNASSRKLSACRSSLTTQGASAAYSHCMQENRRPAGRSCRCSEVVEAEVLRTHHLPMCQPLSKGPC